MYLLWLTPTFYQPSKNLIAETINLAVMWAKTLLYITLMTAFVILIFGILAFKAAAIL